MFMADGKCRKLRRSRVPRNGGFFARLRHMLDSTVMGSLAAAKLLGATSPRTGSCGKKSTRRLPEWTRRLERHPFVSSTFRIPPTMSQRIGFVGVGRMGANMARRLQEVGYTVTAVYDVNRA